MATEILFENSYEEQKTLGYCKEEPVEVLATLFRSRPISVYKNILSPVSHLPPYRGLSIKECPSSPIKGVSINGSIKHFDFGDTPPLDGPTENYAHILREIVTREFGFGHNAKGLFGTETKDPSEIAKRVHALESDNVLGNPKYINYLLTVMESLKEIGRVTLGNKSSPSRGLIKYLE